MHELNQRKILSQHERINHDAGTFTPAHFFKRLRNHNRIQPKRILVDPSIIKRQRRRLAIRNHDNLLHILPRTLQDLLRHTQALACIRIVWPNLHPRKLRDRNLLGRIMKQHQRQRIPGILRPNQVPQRHRHPLGRREPVFPIQNHGMRAVQQHHRRTRTLIVGLLHMQIAILQVQSSRSIRSALPRKHRTQRRSDIQV